jgi:hypothetical protein
MVFDGAMGAAEAEIALIAVRATKGAYEKEGVKEMLEESLSLGLVVLLAAAVGTNMIPAQDGHGLHSRFS